MVDEIMWVNEVPYKYWYGDYKVAFPEVYQGDLTEVILADMINGRRVRSLTINRLPDSVRKLYIPAGIERLEMDVQLGNGLEVVEVESGSKYYSTDGHALYSADGKEMIRLIDNRVETYVVAEGTEKVCSNAFIKKANLKKIVIPSSVSEISLFFCDGFAVGCTALEAVEISGENPCLMSDGKAIYSKDGKNLICVVCDGLGSYAVAEGTEDFRSNAFGGRIGLEHVYLPATVKKARISKSLVPSNECKAPLQFTVAEDNPYIRFEENALYSADGKTLLQVVNDVESFIVRPQTEIIGDEAFEYAPSLKKLQLPEGLKVIGKSAFSRCKELTAIGCQPDMAEDCFIFPSTLEEIGESAFSGRNSIKEVVIGENTRSLMNDAFGSFRIETLVVLSGVEFGNGVFGTKDYGRGSVNCLLLPTMNPSKIRKSIQEQAILGYCRAALAGDARCEVGKAAYQAFLKRNRKKYIEKLTENREIIRYMLASGLIEDTDIDGMIERVEGEKDTAFKAELMEYSKRFSSDGLDREMKRMDQEAAAEEKKLKAETKKADYQSLPLAVRAAMKYKLSPQAKVELLEEVVLHGSIEDLQNVFKVHAPFELTARALGMAVRCRTADFTEELLKNGATFAYASTSAMTRKYGCMVKVTNNYSHPVDYALLALSELDKPMEMEALKAAAVMPVQERCRSLLMICAAGRDHKALQHLLYYAILRCEKEIVDTLKAGGVNRLDQTEVQGGYTVYNRHLSGMQSAPLQERWSFAWALPWKDATQLRWVLDELLEAGDGRGIYFSRPELTEWNERLTGLCHEKPFELVMQGRIDISKARNSEIINSCLAAGNLKGLQYALDQGWAADKAALLKAAKRLGIEDAAVQKWLQERDGACRCQ